MKVNGADMWHKSDDVIAMITAARSRGVDVTFDEYPWDGSSTRFTTLLPAWVSEPFKGSEGGQAAILSRLTDPGQRRTIKEVLKTGLALRVGTEFERILISRCEWNPAFVGTNLKVAMVIWELPPMADGAAEAAIRIIANGGGGYISRSMNDYDIENFMRQPFGMVCDDGGIPNFGVGSVHPRSYGTYAKILGEYVREKSVLTLEQAIYKMTGMPAKRFGFLELGRGMIKEGFSADVTVFDPEKVKCNATYIQPFQYAEGFKAVLVNGEIALREDIYLNVHAGQVLLHKHQHTSST
jgi:N-acyl-D-aspartate/D-glutamate deacylase